MIFNSLTGDLALDLAIMDSDNKRHILESLFEKYISLDFDPNEVQEKVYQEAGFTPKDMLEEDVHLLKINITCSYGLFCISSQNLEVDYFKLISSLSLL